MRIEPLDASAHRATAEATIKGELPFGRVFTPHMVVIEWDKQQGWHGGKTVPRANLSLDPAAMSLHYGQEVFEGLKAHKQDDGSIVMFRVDAGAERMQRSCERCCMPPLPVDDFIAACEALTATERDWVPQRDGASLYLRPTMIATEPALGVRPADTYLFFVLATATGPYFSKGFSGIRVKAEREMVRAAPGGLGTAKTGANYVASMLSAVRAKAHGCDQVLWLDAIEHRYIEETGASNVFWVEKGTLYTPPTSETILKGITRDSILKLAPELGIKVQERRISLDDLLAGIRGGSISEMFGSGTAAVVSPIGEVMVDERIVKVATGEPGPLSKRLLDGITAIHRGRGPDKFGWCRKVV
ncbi:MAG: branched-chain amino acid aminotransferase [Deltaproteobacteria bacterium]|nr:branched-chain amino acid aminotransferase [Deltaproteobacteria bacterium]